MTYQYQFYYLLRRPVTAHAYYPVTAQLLPNNCARLLGASTGHPPVTGQLLGQLIIECGYIFISAVLSMTVPVVHYGTLPLRGHYGWTRSGS